MLILFHDWKMSAIIMYEVVLTSMSLISWRISCNRTLHKVKKR